MGAGASTRIQNAANSSPDDLEPSVAWDKTVLDSVLILGDYAFLGAAALGEYAMVNSIPFAEKGDKKLAAIVDAGCPDLFYKKIMLEDCYKGVKTWVILVPTITSDPRFYGDSLLQMMSVAVIICSCASDGYLLQNIDADIRFIHRDFYYENPIGCGIDWLPRFLEKDEHILPGNQRASMLATLESWAESVYRLRAGVYWTVGNGCEEGALEAHDQMKKRLTDGKAVEDATQYQAPGNVLMVTVTPEGENSQVACVNMVGEAVCSKDFTANSNLGELASFLHGEFPDSNPPTFWQDSEKVSCDSKIADYTTLTATISKGATGLPTIIKYPMANLKFAVGDFHGLAEEFGLKQFEYDDAKLAEWGTAPFDVTIFADVSSLSIDLSEKICQFRQKRGGNHPVRLIIVAKDYESFKCPNMALHLSTAIEDIDTCVFATLDDMEKVKSVFVDMPAGYPDGQILCQAMTAFPRLHFFCLLGHDGKTCGREVPDGSMMFSSVKFGIGAPTLPKSKFGTKQFMHGADGPLHYVTLPGDGKATVIMPCHILVDIFGMALQAECTEGNKQAQKESRENMIDLLSEHAQYNNMQIDYVQYRHEDVEPQEDVEPETQPPDRDPDGTLEDARLFLRTMSLKSIKEVKALGKPPDRLLLPMRACAALLGYTVGEEQIHGWKDIIKMMTDSEELRDKMLALEAAAVTAEQWALVQGFAEQPEFTYQSQKMASSFGAIVTAWVLALLECDS